MGAFRRIVIALADVLAIVSIIGFTIGGGAIAAATAALQSQVLGQAAGGSAAVAFILGAVAGFIVSALLAALLFSLSEIAANTRKTVQLLEGTNQKAHKGAAPGPEPGVQLRVDGPFFNVRSELTPQSQRILETARDKGFEVDIAKDNRAVLIETQQGPIRLNSNKDIEDFGRRARLV